LYRKRRARRASVAVSSAWRRLLLAVTTSIVLLVVVPAVAAAPFTYVTNSGSDSVSQFNVGSGGLLAPLSPPTVPAEGTPGGIAISPNGRNAYATAFDGSVLQYDIGAGGELSPKTPPSVPAGTVPRDVVVSPDGESVYVANVGDELEGLPPSVSQYDVGPDGALSPKSPPSVSSCSDTLGIAITPDGENVYLACGMGFEIVEYDVASDGTLSFKGGVEDEAMSFDVVVSPDGRNLYAGGVGITQWEIEADGSLSPKVPAKVGGSRISANLAISPDGKSVYASVSRGNGFPGDQIDQYDVAVDGTLSPKSPATVAAGNFPRGLALTPDGESLYVANSGSGTVGQYDVAPDGTVTPKTPATAPAGEGPFGVAVTPAPLMPTDKDQCKKGGWRNFAGFRNQGQCIAFVNHARKN
jgi:DNA-binding beta-propeller fold protein YncE